MNEAVGMEISRKLDQLVGLTAVSVLRGKTKKEQVELLCKAGFAVKDIASLVGITSNAVSVALSKLKKANGKLKKRDGEE